jgi:transcriptional regulator
MPDQMQDEVRRSDSILGELDRLQELLKENRQLVGENPSEVALQLNLMSLEAREMMLLEELRESNRRNALDTFDLKIDGKYVSNHRISSEVLGRLLIRFQSVIHSIDHSLKDGPNATRGPIPESVLANSRIDAAAMCEGSFRIVLSSNKPSWFEDSSTKKALERFNKLLDCGDNKDLIKQEIRELGKRPINRYKEFLNTIYKTNTEIKLYDVLKPEGFETKSITDVLAKSIWDVIDLEESIPENEETYRGTLKALDLINYKFKFIVEESGNVIHGQFNQVLTESVKNNLDKISVGHFSVSTKQNELTEELFKVYNLLNFVD